MKKNRQLAKQELAKMDRTSLAVAMLMRGDKGEAVLEWLRAQTPGNLSALSVSISRVRTAILPTLTLSPCVAQTLAPYLHEEGVRSFLSLPLAEMVQQQRAHRFHPTWSEEAEAALARLPLLPSNLAALKLSPAELMQLEQQREAVLLRKQGDLIHVHDAEQWLLHAIYLARQSTVQMSVSRLVIPLLLLSGRRSTELLNGQSSFLPTPRLTTTLFLGQIKKRGASVPYEIPLLCDYNTFAFALGVLRAKQGYTVLDAAACNRKYAPVLNETIPRLFPMAPKAHALRSMYASFVYHLYDHASTFNDVIMRVLGHEKLAVSLSYNSVVLHGAGEPGVLGPLEASE